MTALATARLGDVATVERDMIAPENIRTGTLYVGLEHVESSGQFVGVREVAAGDLASTKFSFDSTHVLYGKLRPYLCKIARPNFTGVCTTEIVPIKPGPRLDRDYLYHFLRQPRMVEFATSRCSGANLPRLSPKTLIEFEIPLPPLAEQKRIAAVLDKADDLRGKRRQALATLDTLLQSVFLDMFGDPRVKGSVGRVATTPVRLGDLTRIRTGKLDANASSPDGEYPFFTCAVNPLRIDVHAFDTKAVLVAGNGDLNVKYYEGKFNAYQRTYVIESLDEARLNPRMLYAFLDLYVGELRRLSIGGVIQYIKLGNLTDAMINLPTREDQGVLEKRMLAIERQRVDIERSTAQIETLFATLQRAAFAGTLFNGEMVNAAASKSAHPTPRPAAV